MCDKRPDVIIVPDADALARVAADRLVAGLPKSDRNLAVCLEGGETAKRLLQVLATPPWRDAVPWQQVHWFWGDDRFVPKDDPRSNSGVARRLLFDHVPVPEGNIVAIPADAASETEAAHRYEAALRDFYGSDQLIPGHPLFDMVLLGLGTDGHTASLFPHRPEVDETARWVVGVANSGLEPFVPRVTLTLPVLASSRETLFLVSGLNKREILSRVLGGADLPAAHVWSDGDLVWLVDREAAPPLSALQVTPPPVRRGRGAAGPAGRPAPSFVVVMGVSGSGKSTVAALLAQRLGWTYEDGDWFHSPASIDKMHAGEPLTDDDRRPWLARIAARIDALRRERGNGVIACSALKRAYRDILTDGHDDVRIVYLKGERDLIARRSSLRACHFMPASLLDSQFATLEEPAADEHAVVVPIDAAPRDIVEKALAGLGIAPPAKTDEAGPG